MPCRHDWPLPVCGTVGSTCVGGSYDDPASYCLCESFSDTGDAGDTTTTLCTNHNTGLSVIVWLVLLVSIICMVTALYRARQVYREQRAARLSAGGAYVGTSSQNTQTGDRTRGGSGAGVGDDGSGSLIPRCCRQCACTDLFVRLPLFRFLVLTVVYSTLTLTESALRLFTSQRVASPHYNSTLVTVLFSLNDIIFWIAVGDCLRMWFGVLLPLLKLNNKLRDESQSVYARLNLYIAGSTGIGLLSGLAFFLTIFLPNQQPELLMTHLACHAGVVAALGYGLYHALATTEPMLADAAASSSVKTDLLNAVAKIKIAKKIIFQQSMMQTIALDLIHIFWPALRNLNQYQIWFGLIISQGCVMIFIWMSRNEKPTKHKPSAPATPVGGSKIGGASKQTRTTTGMMVAPKRIGVMITPRSAANGVLPSAGSGAGGAAATGPLSGRPPRPNGAVRSPPRSPAGTLQGALPPTVVLQLTSNGSGVPLHPGSRAASKHRLVGSSGTSGGGTGTGSTPPGSGSIDAGGSDHHFMHVSSAGSVPPAVKLQSLVTALDHALPPVGGVNRSPHTTRTLAAITTTTAATATAATPTNAGTTARTNSGGGVLGTPPTVPRSMTIMSALSAANAANATAASASAAPSPPPPAAESPANATSTSPAGTLTTLPAPTVSISINTAVPSTIVSSTSSPAGSTSSSDGTPAAAANAAASATATVTPANSNGGGNSSSSESNRTISTPAAGGGGGGGANGGTSSPPPSS